MNTTFSIPEILAIIIGAIKSKVDLAAIARTNKAFKEVALDCLWSHLNSIKPLLLLLGPLDLYTRYNHYTGFSLWMWDYQDGKLSRARWLSFTNYHYRVKRIRIALDDNLVINNQSFPISPALFALVAHTRPFSGPLLPNLHSLTVRGGTLPAFIHSLPFLNDHVRHLELTINSPDDSLMDYALREFACRLPNLETVRLNSDGDGARFQEELLEFVKGLQRPSTMEITVPRHFITTSTLSELAQITSLQKISTDYHAAPIGAPPSISFTSLKPGSFLGLTKLALTLPLTSMLPLIAAEDQIPCLEEIELWSRDATTTEVHMFCNAVARDRPNITSLFLDLFHPSLTPTSSIDFTSFLPLLECGGMTYFFVRHHIAIRLELDNLENLLLHWPKLTSLSITADPNQGTIQPYLGLPMGILDLIARISPNIEHIGLFIDASTTLSWSPSLHLPKIRVLHVGWAEPTHPYDVASYLAGICNHSMKFLVGDSQINPYVNSGAVSPHTAQWLKVERLFRALVRQRRRTLEEVIVKQSELRLGWSQRKSDD